MAGEAFQNLLEVIPKLIVQSAINMETEKISIVSTDCLWTNIEAYIWTAITYLSDK